MLLWFDSGPYSLCGVTFKTHEAFRRKLELPAAAPRAEEECPFCPLSREDLLALHRHPADRIGRHLDNVLELSVLQPQHSVSDILDTSVVRDDHHAASSARSEERRVGKECRSR